MSAEGGRPGSRDRASDWIFLATRALWALVWIAGFFFAYLTSTTIVELVAGERTIFSFDLGLASV
ncbi:MAG: hypothetical protein ACR2KO_06025 [Geodermatophilaceae bacterium]